MSQQTKGDTQVRLTSYYFPSTSYSNVVRNFVPGACVMVTDADRRAGKGEGAIHKLDAITDRKTQRFRGFYKSGIPTEELTMEGGAYIYNCSQL